MAANQDPTNQTINTVALVNQADSKEHVELTGTLTKKSSAYYLKDSTGEVKLDIPTDKNITVPAEGTNVKIYGKIKTNLLRAVSKSIAPVVRVQKIEVLQTPAAVTTEKPN